MHDQGDVATDALVDIFAAQRRVPAWPDVYNSKDVK
jgi:hypothetical protein